MAVKPQKRLEPGSQVLFWGFERDFGRWWEGGVFGIRTSSKGRTLASKDSSFVQVSIFMVGVIRIMLQSHQKFTAC